MQIPVIVERIVPSGFRARGGEPFGLTAEGATREEALQKLREQVKERVARGEIVPLDVPVKDNPVAAHSRHLGKRRSTD